MGCVSFSLPLLTWILSLADKAVMAPNLDSFGRDRAAYQEHNRQRRIAEREARRCEHGSSSEPPSLILRPDLSPDWKHSLDCVFEPEPLFIVFVCAALGGDKLGSRTGRGPSTTKACRPTTRRPPPTSPASAWREVRPQWSFIY